MQPERLSRSTRRRRGLRGALRMAVLFSSSCAAAPPPSVRVVADARGEEFSPLAAGAGIVVTGSRLTAWRPKLLRQRRSADDHPGAIAVAPDGKACATAAAAPAFGLRSYRLPGLEAVRSLDDVCNGKLTISGSSELVACIEHREDAGELHGFVRVFTFPELLPVQSLGPLAASVDALSFVGLADQLAVASTLLAPPGGPNDFRTRLDLYGAQSGRVVGEFSRAGRFPYLAFAPQADIFIWAGQSGAEAWSARSFMKLRAFAATAHTIAVALSPDGRLLATSQQQRAGVQVFDTHSGERLAAFGSAELYAATSPHDSDQMLTDRAQLRVELLLMGTATQTGNPIAVRNLFGGSGYIADHRRLAFADDQTLVSSGRGFLALWSMNHAAIQNARTLH
jgi:hypothetical protein